MRVRITCTLTAIVDGMRLDRFREGNVYEVGPVVGSYLLACEYAEPVSDDTPVMSSVPSSERVLTLEEYCEGGPPRHGMRRHLSHLRTHVRPGTHIQVVVTAERLDVLPLLLRELRLHTMEIIIDRRRGERRLSRQRAVRRDRRRRDRRRRERRVQDSTAELRAVGFAVNATSPESRRSLRRAQGGAQRRNGGW